MQRRRSKHRLLEVWKCACCKTCRAGCERPGLRHNKSRVMNVTNSFRHTAICSCSHTIGIDNPAETWKETGTLDCSASGISTYSGAARWIPSIGSGHGILLSGHISVSCNPQLVLHHARHVTIVRLVGKQTWDAFSNTCRSGHKRCIARSVELAQVEHEPFDILQKSGYAVTHVCRVDRYLSVLTQ